MNKHFVNKIMYVNEKAGIIPGNQQVQPVQPKNDLEISVNQVEIESQNKLKI